MGTSPCCRGLDALLLRGGRRRVLVGDVQPNTKYLTLHVDDPKGLVEHEKGKGIAFLATTAMPEYVENTIYNTIKDELKSQFKEKGSSVTVDIVQTPPKGKPLSAVTREGVFVGLLLAGLGYGVVKLIGRLW